jgi:hypothetical protein
MDAASFEYKHGCGRAIPALQVWLGDDRVGFFGVDAEVFDGLV